jgi:galactokinase/mevalonate kinase-like predicted kinase
MTIPCYELGESDVPPWIIYQEILVDFHQAILLVYDGITNSSQTVMVKRNVRLLFCTFLLSQR